MVPMSVNAYGACAALSTGADEDMGTTTAGMSLGTGHAVPRRPASNMALAARCALSGPGASPAVGAAAARR